MNSANDSISTMGKNLVKSQHYNVMVKVDEDIYYVDKLQLAWKSDYFERLLIEYSDQEECNSIELPLIDTDTFSTVVDIIYGQQTLASVLNTKNYITLLIAMDYLQMEIDLKTYYNFIMRNSVLDANIFQLYNFVRENPNLQYLLQSVLFYISGHMTSLRSNEEFLSLPLDVFTRIIKSHSTDVPSDKQVRDVCEICAEWIHYDLESRLPHATKVANAARLRFVHFNDIKDVDFNAKLTGVAEHMKREQIAKIIHRCLMFDGEVNPAGQELPPKAVDRKQNTFIGLEENGRKKLAKLLENNYFYDIAVKVEEKIYKLHRFKLNSASGYFADIFLAESFNTDTQCAESTLHTPNKNKQYSLRDVDQTTFEMIIEYIYFEEVQLTCENITRLLKAAAADNLRIEKLFDKCVSWMNENIEEVCSKVLIIDECISRSWIKENIKEICSEVLIKPEIINAFPICSISFDVLEKLLFSSSVCCENPYKIVEICSKWVKHDVKNRYHLIPQIAVAINRIRTMEFDDHKMEAPADLNNLSEQLIRDKLWNTLSSISLQVAPATINQSKSRVKKDSSEIPVFTAYTGDRSVRILNADFNQIASFNFLPNTSSGNDAINMDFKVSATLIGDNLFVMLTAIVYLDRFYVYNLTSRKLCSLNCCLNKQIDRDCKYSLLNCRDQVYCCFDDGQILKYVVELNRWMVFSKPLLFRTIYGGRHNSVLFASSGNELYRTYYSGQTHVYIAEVFNFQRNVWLSLTDSRFTPPQATYSSPIDLISINAGDTLAVIYPSFFWVFDLKPRSWRRQISLAGETMSTSNLKPAFALVHCGDELLHVFCNKLYRWCGTNQSWVLKKDLLSRSANVTGNVLEAPRFYTIAAIHRC